MVLLKKKIYGINKSTIKVSNLLDIGSPFKKLPVLLLNNTIKINNKIKKDMLNLDLEWKIFFIIYLKVPFIF